MSAKSETEVAVPDLTARPQKRNRRKKVKRVKTKHDGKKVETKEVSRRPVSSKAINQAINGVRILQNKRVEDNKSKDLLADDPENATVFLQVTMTKLANFVRGAKHLVRPIKLKVFLPNPVVNSNTNVLVITKDDDEAKDIRDDHTENLHRFEHKFRACGAAPHITEVVTLKQLKTEFHGYEAKRLLSNRTDVLLCDDTVVRRVPMFLGNNFYQKRKFPIPINLKSRNLLSEVKRCLTIEILYLPMKGNSGIMKIGRLDQSDEEIRENIMAAISKMQQKFPGGWENVQSIYLKTERSKAVPFYVKIRSADRVKAITPLPLNNRPVASGEVTTMRGNIYTIYPSNKVKKTGKSKYNKEGKKGQKNTMEEDLSDDDDDLAEEEAPKLKGKKSRKKQEKRKVSDIDEAASAKEMAPTNVSKDNHSKKKLKVQEKRKKNKKRDFDSEDEDEKIVDLERAYLRKLMSEEESGPAAESKTHTRTVNDDEEDDDWAEMSDDELGMSDGEDE